MTANQITKKLTKVLTESEMAQLEIHRDCVNVWGDNDAHTTAIKASRALYWGIIDNGFKVMIVPDADQVLDNLTEVNVR